MALMITDIDDYLTSGGVTTPPIFRGKQPPSPDRVVTLYETGGLAPVHGMGSSPGTALVERPEIQVVARSDSYSTARADAEDCYALLDGLYDRTINGTRYLYVEAVHSPFLLDRDEQDRPRISCRFRIMKALTA